MVVGHPGGIIKRKCCGVFHRVTGLTIGRWIFALRIDQPYFLKNLYGKRPPRFCPLSVAPAMAPEAEIKVTVAKSRDKK
jgi:hypothetical protein